MTRQEQKAVKELSAMISKNLKVVAGEHGFKVVSDCAYKVLGDFLYEVFLSAPPVPAWYCHKSSRFHKAMRH